MVEMQMVEILQELKLQLKEYFNVKAKELTLPQAAYIAGIPQALSLTHLLNKVEELKEDEGLKPGIDRMKTVLFRMKETGYITEAEYNEAIDYDITKDFREPAIRARRKISLA